MEYALLGFTLMQRHVAAECLFYLAYHTQLTSEEVVSVIDLIKDLTNGDGCEGTGLPLLDPLVKDVPNPYESVDSLATSSTSWQQHQQQHQQPHYGMGGWMDAPPPPKTKDAKQWEQELMSNLWGRGQPQLLQCVTTLVMSVMCALDARHVLVERYGHGCNSFGVVS
jgi:hypothetical protein